MNWWSRLEKNERTFLLICIGPLLLNIVVSGVLFVTAGLDVANIGQGVFFPIWLVSVMIYLLLSDRRGGKANKKRQRAKKVREPKNADDARLYN